MLYLFDLPFALAPDASTDFGVVEAPAVSGNPTDLGEKIFSPS
jgi:hypothetical protein